MEKITKIYPNQNAKKGNQVLRQIAKEVRLEEIKSAKIKNIIKKMQKVLSESNNGVALAAPQIGESVRIFIVAGEVFLDEKNPLPQENKQPLPAVIFINPVIKKISRKTQVVNEGCLSVDKIFGTIKRAEKVTTEAYDENGKKFSRGASGLLAQIIQHEIDHLNGILFIDKATNLEKLNG